MGRIRALVLPLLLLAVVSTACGGVPLDTASVITASVLVEPSAGEAHWYRDMEIPSGTDGYELLAAATGGQVEADYFPEFRSHFVKTVLGIAPEGQQSWAAFLWNEHSGSWEPLPYGADWLSVKEGHIMGWALVEYSPDTPQLPTSQP